MISKIVSKTNRRIVDASKLKSAKGREEAGLFLVEGFHLLEMALREKVVERIFAAEKITDVDVDQYLVTPDVLSKLAASKTPQGVVAVCHKKKARAITADRVVYLDEINDPGNMGAILRTALAFGYRDIIISENSVSPYNDKAISASQGALFAVNIVEGDVDTIKSLKGEGYQIISTALGESVSLAGFVPRGKHVVLFGNETRGVSAMALALSDSIVRIAIEGIDSLNVAVASGIVLYELSKTEGK